MLRRFSVLTAVWAVLFALLSSGTALAQDDSAEGDEEVAEVAYYGDAELIDVLRTYGFLDEWISASPVSPPASLLQVTGSSEYQAQREKFLNSLEAWADRTEVVRSELTRIEVAQANADLVRSMAIQVRDALVLDDRLAPESTTLGQIENALSQLAGVEIPEDPDEPSEHPLTLAEIQLNVLRNAAETELVALNGVEPAISSSGVEAFVGFEELLIGLDSVDQLVKRGRDLIRPAREESERLASAALDQIPNLHAARMLGSSDVGGLSIVTVDAYIRAAARSSCSVDWALLAGIGKIESNHGRLGGAAVSRSGQVSSTILGPLLDGGQTEREAQGAPRLDGNQLAAISAVNAAGQAARVATQEALENSSWGLPRVVVDWESQAGGNGFAVVIDTDGGRLDGNDRWDRAVGPMQFIPETWSKWATDGNGDGVSDPNNLYDASTAAARFLCDLSANRGSSPSTFVLGYNSSTSYVRSVLSAAQALRATSLPVP